MITARKISKHSVHAHVQEITELEVGILLIIPQQAGVLVPQCPGVHTQAVCVSAVSDIRVTHTTIVEGRDNKASIWSDAVGPGGVVFKGVVGWGNSSCCKRKN